MTQAVNTIIHDALRDVRALDLIIEQYVNTRPEGRNAVLVDHFGRGWLHGYQVVLLNEALEK